MSPPSPFVRLRDDLLPLRRPTALEVRSSSSVHVLPGRTAFEAVLALEPLLRGDRTLAEVEAESDALRRRVLRWLLTERLAVLQQGAEMGRATPLARYVRHLVGRLPHAVQPCRIIGEGQIAETVRRLLPALGLVETKGNSEEKHPLPIIGAKDGELDEGGTMRPWTVRAGLADGLGVVEVWREPERRGPLSELIRARRRSRSPLAGLTGQVATASEAGPVFVGMLAQQAVLRAFEQAFALQSAKAGSKRILAIDPLTLRVVLIDPAREQPYAD